MNTRTLFLLISRCRDSPGWTDQKIHGINKDTHFIILSGYGEFEYAKKAMQYGVKHYLLKPCSEEQIIESLQDVIKDYTNYLATRGEIPRLS